MYKPKDFTINVLEYSEELSRGTDCMEVQVFIKGEPTLVATNDGSGGVHRYYPVDRDKVPSANRLVDTINADLKKSSTNPHFDLDWLIGELMDKHLLEQYALELLQRITFINDKGELIQLDANVKPKPELMPIVKEAVWWKPEFIILNELPLSDVIKKLKELRSRSQ